MTDTPGLDDAIDAADAILWRDGKRPVTPRGDVISDAVVAACKVVAAATREAVAAEIAAAIEQEAEREKDASTWPSWAGSNYVEGVTKGKLRAANIARAARGVPVDGKEQQP